MSTFKLRIVSPDGIEYEGEAESITLRAADGDLTVQKDHADLTTTFGVTPVKIKVDGNDKNAACSDGFMTVSKNVVTVVATTFEFADSIDLARAVLAKEKAEKALEQRRADTDLKVAEMKLKRALNRISVANGL